MAEKKLRRVKTLSGFIKWAAQFNNGEYLFRGVSKDSYKIEASAYRRLKTNKTASQLLKVNQELIEKAKTQGHDQKNGRPLSDLDLLAELQHFGAATCLMDFSRNALVALWFACQQSSKDEEKNGKVFAVRSDDPARFKTVTPDLIEKKIDHFFELDEQGRYPLYQWEPKLQNNRIIAQHSVFVFGGAQIEAETECVVMLSSKEAILKSLAEISDVTEASMFPDFDGFARLHAHDKPYIEPDARGHLQRGIEAYQRRKLDDAIAYYTKVIELDPTDTSIVAQAYYNRGGAYHGKRKFEHAIADYTRAIDLKPDFDVAYNDRGLAYNNLRDYNNAINDFDRAIEIDPTYPDAYNNRGVAYIRQRKHDRAIDDYNRAIELNYVLAYFNRAEVLLHQRKWKRAKSDLTTAKEKGVDIINGFINIYTSVTNFQSKTGITLPEDIAEMLTAT